MWTSIISGAITLFTYVAKGVGSLISWVRDRGLIKQGIEKQQQADLKSTVEVLTKVNEARKEARDAASSIPESASLPDDGFRRD